MVFFKNYCNLIDLIRRLQLVRIYPGRYFYLTLPGGIAVYTMEDIISDFSKQIAGENWILVAGKNFDCDSSREHVPRAILCAGVK